MNNAGILPGGCYPDPTRFPAPIDVEVDCGVWDLRARPDLLTRAADAWRDHGDQTSTAAEHVHGSCRDLLDSERLTGALAQRFDDFESELIAKLDQFEGVAERVAEQLAAAARYLRGHQETLDSMRAAILAKVPGRETRLSDGPPGPVPGNPTPVPRTLSGPDGVAAPITGFAPLPPTHIVFQASSFDDLRAIEDAKAEAEEVRADVDKRNAEVHGKLDEIARDLGMMGRDLHGGGCVTPSAEFW